MIYLPSFGIQEKMVNENSGLFFEQIFDKTVPFVVKLPTNIIKAVYNGCDIKLYLSIERIESGNSNTLTVGIALADDEEHPYITFHTVNNIEELNAILKAFQKSDNKLYLFDELDRNVLSGEFQLLEGNKEINDKLFSTINTNINEKSKTEVENRFIEYMEEFYKGNTQLPITLFTIKTKFNSSEPSKIIDIDVGETKLSQFDEGLGLELAIQSLLHSYYHGNSFHSPDIIKKGKKRELTDILAFQEDHIIIIESKVSQVLNREKELNSQRLLKNIHNNIDKAIRQLKGTLKTINSKQEIYSLENDLIDLPISSIMRKHCIVLISEMRHELEWDKLYDEIIKFENESFGLLHILDLTELFRILYLSKTPEMFNKNLYIRWSLVYENKAPLARVKYKEEN